MILVGYGSDSEVVDMIRAKPLTEPPGEVPFQMTVITVADVQVKGVTMISKANLLCRLYNKSSKNATSVLLRQIPLFCTLIAEVMRNDFFRKTTDTQKE